MKIAIISIMEKYPWGGSEELWRVTAIEALKNNIDVVASYKKWSNPSSKILELQKKDIKLFLRKKIYKKYTLLQRIINKVIKPKQHNVFENIFKEEPDLILINEGAVFNVILFLDLYSLLLNNKIPFYILSQQNRDYGTLSYENYLLSKNIYNKAKKLFFVSKRNLETAKRQLASDLHHAEVVRNPINLSNPSYIPYPKQKNINLAFVGRLSCNQKAQEILFDTIRTKKWKNRDFTVNLYGKGEDEQYLKDLVEYYKLGDKVIFNGFTKVDEIWKNNHALILTSIREGMPIVIVEAMLAGRVIITTDVAGNTEWVQDDINGFIAKAPSIKEIDYTLEKAWNNIDRWEEMGKNARERALKLYDENSGKTLLTKILGN